MSLPPPPPVPLALHQFRVAVGDAHRLAVSLHGNPKAGKAIVLHGGPGAGCSGAELNMFDLDNWHVALYDQRGAGESLPYASTEMNTMADLVADVSTMRDICFGEQHKVTLVGGSWGSCLTMLAAIENPDMVERIVLRGVFFGDEAGAKHIAEPSRETIAKAPQWYSFYDEFLLPELREKGLINAYDHLMQNGTYEQQREAARHFMAWDTAIAFPSVNEHAVEHVMRNPDAEIPITKIFMHYARHEFVAANRAKILAAQDKLANIPIDIIHGEMDWICPVQNALDLKAAYPHANLHIVQSAGHSAGDPKISHGLHKTINFG